MQHKIRINDLARELEVKSKAILDVLIKVGVTEKKTHSSSIEEDEAERVKKYFAEHEPGSSRSSRASAAADEFKPKIDLSHISKPGDVLKAITQRAAQPAAPPRPATPPSQATPAAARPTIAAPPAVPPRPPAPVSHPAVASTQPAAPLEPPKPAPRFITPQSVARPPAAIVIPPKPPAPPAAQQTHAPSVSEAARPSEATIDNQVAVLEEPETELSVPEATAAESTIAVEPDAATSIAASAPPPANRMAPARPGAPAPTPAQGGLRPPLPGVSPRPGQPQQPGATATGAHAAPRRLIVPQTGPRPVYTAPVRPAAATPPRGAMPERGKPIFQRPRPGGPPMSGAPGTRPPMRPGERRGPHPTRSGAPGTRPGFAGGPGVGAPPPPTGQRPMGRPARPGQRYVPRGVKEGPMKGFVPPPRLSLSSEPLPITRSITIPEGISVKDLAEKLGIRAKDLIARLLARGVFATVNQTLDSDLATEMARHFGAETSVITFEEQLAKDTAPTEGAGEDGGAGCDASAGGHHHGPRRSWQDQLARRDSFDQRR